MPVTQGLQEAAAGGVLVQYDRWHDHKTHAAVTTQESKDRPLGVYWPNMLAHVETVSAFRICSLLHDE